MSYEKPTVSSKKDPCEETDTGLVGTGPRLKDGLCGDSVCPGLVTMETDEVPVAAVSVKNKVSLKNKESVKNKVSVKNKDENMKI